MEESESAPISSQTNLSDNAEEIGWVFYGLLATILMAAYQFFIVQFLNTPSTISVKMALSIATGVVAILIVSVIELTAYYKRKKTERKARKARVASAEEIIVEQANDSQSDNETIGRKNSLWKYMTK